MPFRSQAQLRKFRAMVRRGEMDEATLERWLSETTDVGGLPERVEIERDKHPNRRKVNRANRRGGKKHLQQYKPKGRPYVTKGRRIVPKGG